MIHAAITKATDEVPKMFETGWDWWAWPIAWVALAAVGLMIALALPMVRTLIAKDRGLIWRVPATGVCLLAGMAAVIFGWLGPGILMRHMDNSEGAFWVFVGCLAMAGFTWYAAGRILDATADPYYDWTGSYSPWEGQAGKMAAAPAVVIGTGALFGGIAEIVTRLAASIPMGVAQFLGLAGSVLLFVGIWVALQLVRQRGMSALAGTITRGTLPPAHDSMVGVTEGDKTNHVQSKRRGRPPLPVPLKPAGHGCG